MNNSLTGHDKDGWTAADFVDTASTDAIEYEDPWSEPPEINGMETSGDATVTTQLPLFEVNGATAERPTQATDELLVDTTRGQKSTAASEIGDAADELDSTYLHEDDEGPDVREDDESGMWDEPFPDSPEGFFVQDLNDSYMNGPEPLAEYDSDLADPLYDSDGDIDNLSVKLRLDELIASLRYSTTDEQNQISEILSELSPRKLSNSLRWLNDQDWTGASLLLFLQFRELWNETPQWWEYSTWSHWLDRWWMYSNRNVLSRDACCDLIQHRLHCQPEDVIDEVWFRDWDDFQLWKYGFFSFASFAVFRASLTEGEDWKIHLPDAAFDGDRMPLVLHRNSYSNDLLFSQEKYYVREDDTLHRTHANGPPLWFAVQDWYDYADWHDNLGWAGTWAGSEHPYLWPESPIQE